MIIIGFANNTSKLLPRIFCRPPRHCAPIVRVAPNKYIMYQFVRRGQVAQISLNSRAIKLLRTNGWQFIVLNSALPRDFMRCARHAYSCVALCKYAISIYAPFIQTPWALYKSLESKVQSAKFKCRVAARQHK